MSYAQNNLGWMYRNGNGVAKDYALAFSGTNKLHYKAIVTRKTIWPIFMKTEKALLKQDTRRILVFEKRTAG